MGLYTRDMVMTPTSIDTQMHILTYSPVCVFCKHLTRQRECAAFAGDVPLEIWNGDNDHRKPYPGDNGIQFEPVGEEE